MGRASACTVHRAGRRPEWPGSARFGVEIDPKAAPKEGNNIFVERPTNYAIMASEGQ
jgi:hypothetical protein